MNSAFGNIAGIKDSDEYFNEVIYIFFQIFELSCKNCNIFIVSLYRSKIYAHYQPCKQ